MALGVMTLYPYMNARDYPLVNDNMLLVPYNGTITFKWGVEQAGINKPTLHVITAEGRWGSNNASHFPIVVIRDTMPGTAIPFVDFATMQSNINAYPAASYGLENDTGVTFAVVGGTNYYALIQGQAFKAWAPVRTRTAAGTAVINGVSCDLYTAALAVADVPQYQNEVMSSDEVFELCWSGNGRHRVWGWDAEFKLTPAGVQLHEDIFVRTEMNMRTAGEKAIFEDEFVTLSQIEAGNGIVLKYRDASGSLSGYTTVNTKGYNLVIESQGGSTVEAAYETAAIYYTNTIGTLQFRDYPLLTVEPEDHRIPVLAQVSQQDGKTVVSHYAAHNNLYVSKRSIIGVNTYPMADALFEEQTVHHLRFADTSDVTWNITGTRMPTQTPEGIVYRKGIVIEADFVGDIGMSQWYFTNYDNITPETVTVTNNDMVVFDGLNSVVVTTYAISAGTSIIEIDRPFTIQHNNEDVGSSAVTHIDFNDEIGSTTFEGVLPIWKEIKFEVDDYDVIGDPLMAPPSTRRRVKAFAPVRTGMASYEWFMDADAGAGDMHVGNGILLLALGPRGTTAVDEYSETVNDLFAYTDTNEQIRFNPASAFATWTRFVNSGSYYISTNIEGMIYLDVTTTINPIIHPRVHLFFRQMRGGVVVRNESLGIYTVNDFVPPGVTAAQYRDVFNSRSWSIQGDVLCYANKDDKFIFYLSFDPGIGEQQFRFQANYQTTEMIKLQDVFDVVLPEGGIYYSTQEQATAGNQAPAWNTMTWL